MCTGFVNWFRSSVSIHQFLPDFPHVIYFTPSLALVSDVEIGVQTGVFVMAADKPTIDMVASLAKVSKTTISRYLNGRFEFMSDETRKRIQTVIEELDYRPNNLARGLKSNRSGLIGVLVADIGSPFSSILVKGVGDTCKERGYQTIIANTDNDPEKEREYIRSLIDNRVEGLIVNITGENDDFLLELKDEGIPIVVADRPMETLSLDTVTSNNAEMTYRTIQHLYEQGFERVAFITQEISQVRTRYVRYHTFLKACRDLFGVDGEKWVHVIDPSDVGALARGLQAFLNMDDGPAAAFAVNGVMLLSLVKAIRQLGLVMPDDLGVVGYDDWDWASLIPPGITTISQPSYNVGVQSALRLIQRIKDNRPKPKLIELPSELIVRGSSVRNAVSK
jgi:LacI family transcriptional regulator, kdg operon repressor